MRVGAPFLTWYGDERVELSYATFGNWVAKTANLLRDGYDVQPSDRVAVKLPPHWQTVVIVFAIHMVCGEVGDSRVRFVWRDGVVIEPDEVDYATEVLAYGDWFPWTYSPAPGEITAGERVLLQAPKTEQLVEVARQCYAVGASLVVGETDPEAERVTRILDP